MTILELLNETCKKITTPWNAGKGKGILCCSMEPNSWYHLFKLVKSDGTKDYGMDIDVRGRNLLKQAGSEYSIQKRIISILTDKNAEIRDAEFDTLNKLNKKEGTL